MSEAHAKSQQPLLPQPFLRWAGGKSKALELILEQLPPGRVYSPCVGGGAVEFALRSQGRQVVFADLNAGLMNTYRQLRDNLAEVLDVLEDAQAGEFSNIGGRSEEADAETLAWSKSVLNTEPRQGPKSAAAFIVANRLCFNGLYRENQDGEFNVAFDPSSAGKDLVRAELLTACSKALQGQPIVAAPFQDTLAQVGAGDVAWFDSPYWPGPDPSGKRGLFGPELRPSFTGYTAQGFTTQDHSRALTALIDVRRRGGWTVSTNAWEDGWVSRYRRQGFVAVPFDMARNVASTTEARADVREVLFIGAPLR